MNSSFMSRTIKIKRGLNIPLKGQADKVLEESAQSETFALKPQDFHGIRTKLVAKEGSEVKAGSPLFYNKDNEKVMFTAPISGEVVEVKRGAKRKVVEVKILADKEVRYEEFGSADPNDLSREQIVEKMINSGVWPALRERPYSVVPNPDAQPKSIFISAFDTNPLAPDHDYTLHGQEELFQTGLDAIAKLTDGKVFLNLSADQTSTVLQNAQKVTINRFSGPHPAGNVGVQIHHLDPIDPGDSVWHLKVQDVAIIGKLFKEGKYDPVKVVALTGPSVDKPKYYRTRVGSSIKEIVAGNVVRQKEEDVRYISGNVLTGERIAEDGYIGYYDDQVTVLPEGNHKKFFLTEGWLSPGLNKFSASKAYPSWLMPGRKYDLDTNMNGEERAYVMTGQYEKVFPFEIYPQHLVKAILINDIELMEKLGIYEVDAEDFALCEYVCTSKIEVQRIVREGMDMLKQEMS